MIELTDEMKAAVKRRMGVPDGHEMDPWMGSAIEDVLAIVERDLNMQPRPDGSHLPPPAARAESECTQCGTRLRRWTCGCWLGGSLSRWCHHGPGGRHVPADGIQPEHCGSEAL